MKKILTEWRKFIEEERKPFAERFPKDFTIAKFEELYRGLSDYVEDQQAKEQMLQAVGQEGVAILNPTQPAINVAAKSKGVKRAAKKAEESGNSLLIKLFNWIDGKPAKARKEYIQPENIVLDLLDVDPHLSATIDPKVMDEIDSDYRKYLGGLPSETKMSEIRDVDDFVRGWVKERTNMNVVIYDENPEEY
jgi:hypothetical protein